MTDELTGREWLIGKLSDLMDPDDAREAVDEALLEVEHALLRKYIAHVAKCEGIDFLRDADRNFSGVGWTDAEWAALQRLRD